MADKKQGGGVRGFFKRKMKLRKDGLLGSVNKRQAALDEAAAPMKKKKG